MIDTIRHLDRFDKIAFGSMVALAVAFIVALPLLNAQAQDETARCEAKGGTKVTKIYSVKPMIVDTKCMRDGKEIDI